MKKITYLLFMLVSMISIDTYGQCTPVYCPTSPLVYPFGGLCDSTIMDGNVNVPYSDFVSFFVKNTCFNPSVVLDPSLPNLNVKIKTLRNITFSNLPAGITAGTNAVSYTSPSDGSPRLGCGYFTGTPTQAGVFNIPVSITADLILCGIFPIQQTQSLTYNLEFIVYPDASFAGLTSSYCSSDPVATLTPTGTQGGTFSGPGVSGNTFNPALAGPGLHTITYTVSAQEGSAIAPTTSSSSVNLTVTACPVNCEVSAWSSWSTCTETCGGGTQTRTRTVITPASNGGADCPVLEETRACNEQPCPIDCEVSAWSNWSTCTETCGGGTQTRTRTVITPASNGGVDCSVLEETRACNEQACPIDCEVSEWSNWSECSEICGGGTQVRTLTVVTEPANGGAECPVLEETRACNEQPCPIDCIGSWGDWSQCTESCGGGIQTRAFTVSVAAQNGGRECAFADGATDTRACNEQSCCVNPGGGECADLEVTKTAAPSVIAGELLLYTIHVNNKGPGIATNVVLTDILPFGSALIDMDAPGWTIDISQLPDRIIASRPTMAVDSTSIINLTIHTPSNLRTGALIQNIVNISSDVLDPNVANNLAFARTSVTDSADISITKTAADTVAAGENLTYTITITNPGPSDAFGVSFIDQLPAGTRLVSLTTPTGWPESHIYYGSNLFGEIPPIYGTPLVRVPLSPEMDLLYPFIPEDGPKLEIGTNGQVQIEAGSSIVLTLVVEVNANLPTGEVLTNHCFLLSDSNLLDDPDTTNNSSQVATTVVNCDDGNPCTLDEFINGECVHSTIPECTPVDCEVSDWSDWSDCTVECGIGSQTRTRTIITPAQNGGAACPELEETRPCGSSPTDEVCNGIDDDCDGLVDALDPGLILPACEKQAGVCTGARKDASRCVNGSWLSCSASNYEGYSPNFEVVEVTCDARDNDCDGSTDEGGICDPINCEVSDWSDWSDCTVECGIGSQTRTRTIITPAQNGGAVCPELEETRPCGSSPTDELCNGIDDDCDGLVDALDPTMIVITCENQTGVCSGSRKPADRCVNGTWLLCQNGDYEAHDPIFEVGTETICDNKDNNCDGQKDEGLILTYYWDNDGDGFGDASHPEETCDPLSWYVLDSTDCDDGDDGLFIYPGATEICNGRDDNCDGNIDEGNICPVDCIGAWSDWSDCTVACGGGIQTRTYVVTVPAQNGGRNCDFEHGATQQRACNEQACCDNTWFSGDYGSCSEECGGGIQTRDVVCRDCEGNNLPDGSCSGPKPPATQTCNEQPCPVDCIGAWSDWSDCTVACGGGLQTRTFEVTVPAQHGGRNCDFEHGATQQLACNEQACCDNTWFTGDYGSCSEECGGGVQTKDVVCRDCEGNNLPDGSCSGPKPPATQACNTQPCPVDCVVSDWSAWSACSAECGGGTQSRTRTIITPPQNGGTACPNLVETRACNEQACGGCNNAPVRPGRITGPSPRVCLGRTSQYSIAPVPGATSYVWTVTNGGTVTAGQGSVQVTITFPNVRVSYNTIRVKAVNDCGSSPLKYKGIWSWNTCAAIQEDPSENAVGGDILTRTLPASGLDVKVYPNPSSGLVNIAISQVSANEEIRFRVLNIQGSELRNVKYILSGEQTIQLDLKELPQGVYLLETTTSAYRKVIKLVIE